MPYNKEYVRRKAAEERERHRRDIEQWLVPLGIKVAKFPGIRVWMVIRTLHHQGLITAALSRKDIEKSPNIGKKTIARVGALLGWPIRNGGAHKMPIDPDTPVKIDKLPFKIPTEGIEWSNEVEDLLKTLYSEVAKDIVATIDVNLGAWFATLGKEDFKLRAFVDEEGGGENLAEKAYTLTELFEHLNLTPREVAYARTAYEHLLAELEMLTAKIRTALENATGP